MPERPRPDFNQVRDAMRERDEAHEDEARRSDDAPQRGGGRDAPEGAGEASPGGDGEDSPAGG